MEDLKPIKICGINDIASAKAVGEYGAAFTGFVFVKTSPRYVTPEKALELSKLLSNNQNKVALISDFLDEQIESILSKFTPNYLQLHGNEDINRVKQIKKKFGLKIIKAIGISSKEDLNSLEGYEQISDMLLFDAKPKKGELNHGGNGISFNWDILRNISIKKPYFIAGGIDISNAKKALKISGADYIDLSSGVEIKKGVKDPNKIKDILEIF